MQEILAFLKSGSPFYFATVEGHQPRVRPFGFCMEFEGKLYFGMGTHKKSYKQVLDNPNIEVCTTNDQRQWIRIRGTAVIDRSEEALAQAFDTSPFLKTIYNDQSGLTMGLLYIENGVAEISDMSGYFKEIRF